MKLRTLGLASAAFLAQFMFAQAANAVLITETQTLTVQGQDMTFNFGSLAPTDGTGGVLTIATGASLSGTEGLDLSGAFPLEDENFEVTLDGASQGFFSCGGPSNNGATAIAGAVDNSTNFNDCVFSLPIALGGAFLDSLLADSMVSLGVFFGDDVSTFGDDDQVVASLRYNSTAVPEPSTLALLGLGLAGFAGFRRKQKS